MQNDNRTEIRRSLGHGLPQEAPRTEAFIVIRTGIYQPGAAQGEGEDWDLGIYARLLETFTESR